MTMRCDFCDRAIAVAGVLRATGAGRLMCAACESRRVDHALDRPHPSSAGAPRVPQATGPP